MGRAILILKKQGLAEHREMVLDCCTHLRGYDRQIEENRAEYLYPVVRESAEAEWFGDKITDALLQTYDGCDAEQLFDLAALFARDGHKQAWEAIYEKFRRNDTDEPFTGAEALVRLDGTDGLVAALDFVGSSSVEGNWFWESDYLVRDAEELYGIEEVRLALQKASTMPGVAAFLERVQNEYSPFNSVLEIRAIREESLAERRADRYDIPENTLWCEIKHHPEFTRVVSQWMRDASDEEFRNAATDLPSESDPERLKALLFGFGRRPRERRPYPLHPQVLIDLVGGENEIISIRALSALEQVTHDEVRALFFRLKDDADWSDRALWLLRHNYQPGDDELIIGLLERETDADKLHTMCIAVRNVIEDNCASEGLRLLLLVYEKGPCSCCRHGCVELLRDRNAVPDWMAEECLHDAYSETRKLAAELLGH